MEVAAVPQRALTLQSPSQNRLHNACPPCRVEAAPAVYASKKDEARGVSDHVLMNHRINLAPNESFQHGCFP